MALNLAEILDRRNKRDIKFYNDDIKVLNTFVEYDQGNRLNHMIYEMEITDKAKNVHHFFKSIKFVRIIRLPRTMKQSERFIDMHSQVLSGVWEQDVNMVTIIANMIEPVPLGLLFLYGIQGIAEDLETAKEIADSDFAALGSMLQGTYRQLEFRPIVYDETEWLREKMYGMKHISTVRGLPLPRQGGTDFGDKGFGATDPQTDSQDTIEEFIAGMSDREYVIQILSTPVGANILREWLTQTAKEMSRWISQMQGTKAMNFGISIPMMYMANLGASDGWTHGYSDAENVGLAQSHTEGSSFSESVSTGHNISAGDSFSQNVSNAMNVNQGSSVSENVSGSQGITDGSTVGHSYGIGENAGINHSDGTNASVSATHSEGTNYSYSEGENTSQSHSKGISESTGTSQTHTVGDSVSETNAVSSSHGVANGQNQSVSDSHGYSKTDGSSASWGQSHGTSKTDSLKIDAGASAKVLKVDGGYSHSWGSSDSTSNTMGFSNSIGETSSRSVANGVSQSESFSNGTSHALGTSHSVSDSYGTTSSRGTSEGWTDSYGQSVGQSWGASASDSLGVSRGVSSSDGWSQGISANEGVSSSQSQTSSLSASQGFGKGQNVGEGATNTQAFGAGQSVSEGYSSSHGFSKGQNVSDGTTNSWGRSQGVSTGTSGALSQATAATMGIGPSLSFSKSFQWQDIEAKNIVTLLEFQNARLMKALNGNGAFFTDVYIATPDKETKAAAQSVAKSAWYNENALICPLQVMDLDKDEQSHLLYHFNAFSADTTREGVEGQFESYRHSTILLPEEQTAYTHLPRISEGGVFADVLDVPRFSVPSMRKGEIYMGKILSGERWTQKWGYMTPFDYRISSQELMHGFFTGESRSGKTVAATRFIAELANKITRDGKHMRIVCMDPKQDWRILAKFIDPERFHFYSLGNPEFLPINLNICKIPHNVYPQQWVDGIIEIYCRAYGLGERGKSVLSETFFELYDQAGVFVPEWRSVAPERSKQVTLPKIYQKMLQTKIDLEDPRKSGRGKVGNDVRDAYARVLDRLQVFGRPFSIEAQLFGREDGIGIDDLIGKDDVVVLESYGLESTFKNFVFGMITSGFFKYAQAHQGGFRAPDQYETVLVIEEANEILTGQDTADQKSSPLGGQSEFEKILDQSAGLGLFIFSITQKIADIPSSIIANSGLVFAGKISREKDITTVIRKIGREERYDDRDLVKWFPRSPIGWFVCRSSRNYDFKEVEPVLVKIASLNVDAPSNEELAHIMALRTATMMNRQG